MGTESGQMVIASKGVLVAGEEELGSTVFPLISLLSYTIATHTKLLLMFAKIFVLLLAGSTIILFFPDFTD